MRVYWCVCMRLPLILISIFIVCSKHDAHEQTSDIRQCIGEEIMALRSNPLQFGARLMCGTMEMNVAATARLLTFVLYFVFAHIVMAAIKPILHGN